MTKNIYIPLTTRSIISIEGDDSINFLQGIISNDINKVNHTHSIYSLLLTPQGKFLFDFFITMIDNKYYIDCWNEQKESLIKRLKMYKLRSNVTITDVSNEYESVALMGEKLFEDDKLTKKEGVSRQFCKGVTYIDPRNSDIFGRAIIQRDNLYQSFICHGFEKASIDEYNFLRIQLIIPDGENDLTHEKSFPLQFNMAKLNAIDFQKGCYVGQEVTTRSYHRGTSKKQVCLLEIDENKTYPKYKEININNSNIGYLLSSEKNIALGLLNIAEIHKTEDESTITCNGNIIKILDEQAS